MSIKFIDNLILDIYLKKYLVNNIDFKSQEDLEKYLKNLFKLLKSKYDITIEGFYEISVYVDKYYGVVLHLEKEDLEYYDYFRNQVDMRIVTIETDFLYQIDDVPSNILNKVKVCVKDNNLYLKIKEELTELEMMNLIENSKLVYDM